jgi:fatty acid desaturase
MTDPVPERRSATLTDDSSAGLTMLFVFTAAALIATGAVALLAVIGTWWMLAAAFAVYVAMTGVVVLAISHAMGGAQPLNSVSKRTPLPPPRPRRFLSRPRAPWPT